MQRERDSWFEFCLFGRAGKRGLARSFAGCAASGPVGGEGSGEGGRRLPAEAGMGAFGVVVPAPGRERGAGMVQGRERRFVQQLITQSAVEALDEEQLRAMGSSEPATVRHGLPGAMECQSILR